MTEMESDIAVIGAGLGGFAAAYAALRMGRRVILCEETDWIGGQLTAQGVPPDENPWIDSHGTGCTRSYRQLREGIRDYYRRYYPLTRSQRDNPAMNPGAGNVSPLCHEPKVALAVLEGMLAPYLASGRLVLLLNRRPIRVETKGDSVDSVEIEDTRTGEKISLHAPFFLDATELGDLLPLGNIEHVTGAESSSTTGELHAREGDADPHDQQAISWVFAVDYHPDGNFTIPRPANYDFWRGYRAPFWPDRHLSWVTPDPISLEPVYRPIFAGPREDRRGEDLWHYRRILYTGSFDPGEFESDIVVVNWPQIDYWLLPVAGVSGLDRARAYAGARELSLSVLYWMQTDAPRPDGGAGYPGLRLRGDVLGTDGLAKQVYAREGARIQAEFTILEQHIGVEARRGIRGAEPFADSVGIGSYRIDLHPSTSGRNYIDINNYPQQIPLGSLIPIRIENLLPACKDLGVTHVTNGCYRLHPIEWNIGEAVGALAAHCLDRALLPRQVYRDESLREEFQELLVNRLGFVLQWPEELRVQPRDKVDPLGI